MTDNFLHNLEIRYSKLTDEELIKIVSVESVNYSADAIELAQKELSKRGINDLPTQSNGNHYLQQTENKIKNPIARNILRIILYIVWVVVWLFLLGLYSMSREDIRKGIIGIIKLLGVNNISTISILYGIISSLIFLLMFYVLYKGFRVITRETK